MATMLIDKKARVRDAGQMYERWVINTPHQHSPPPHPFINTPYHLIPHQLMLCYQLIHPSFLYLPFIANVIIRPQTHASNETFDCT